MARTEERGTTIVWPDAGSWNRPLPSRPAIGRLKAAAALTIVACVAGGGWLVYATGGTQVAFLHVLYLPVLLGAWVFGVAGGVVTGVVAGLVVGPLMPIDVEAGIAQHPANWLYRMAFFVLVGAVSGAVARLVARQFDTLRASEARFSSVVENAADMILVVASDGGVRYASPSVRSVLGYEPCEVVGTALRDLVHPADRPLLVQAHERAGRGTAEARHGRAKAAAATAAAPDGTTAARPSTAQTPELLEMRARHADGAWRQLELTITDLRDDPSVRGLLIAGRDITERRTMEAQLLHQALHDPLTGLANRALFTERLSRTLAQHRSAGVTVLAIHLERVRAVRDTFGHDAGDRVVCALAERLQGELRQGDVLSRHDGDELAMSCPGVGDPGAALRIAERLLARLREPVLIADDEVFASASVGVRTARDAEAQQSSELLRDAYTAMRYALSKGGDRAELYSPQRRAEAASWLRTRSALARALDRGELRVHYQPIVSLGDYRVRSCEALLRWQHPTRGLVPPSEFVLIAEQTGVIVPIGAWVLREATAQLRAWQDTCGDAAPERVSVNLSVRQLTDAGLVRTVSESLAASGLDPGCLTLEITETMLVDDVRMRERLGGIEELGVGIAIDDFGTGYSALGYLQEFPCDTLKIDRAFIRDLGTQEDDPIVTAIIGLAHRLGLGTVAEGVETQAQAERLRAWDCEQAQGYLFARPQAAEAIGSFLRAQPSEGQHHFR